MENQSNVNNAVSIDSFLSAVSERSCEKYWEAFSNESKNENDPIIKSNLELMKDITSYCFNFDEFSVGFRPLFDFYQNGRAPIPEDLDDIKIQNLVVLLDEVSDYELKARIADVLQFRSKVNRIKYANIAVDSYINSLNNNIYPRHDYLNRVIRMCQISKKYVRGAKNISEKAVVFFETTIKYEIDEENYYYAIELLKIFSQYGLIETEKKENYTLLCEKTIRKLEEKEHLRAAEIGYEAAIEYFSTESTKKILQVSLANLCVKLSNLETHIQKLHHLRKAISLYRSAGSNDNKKAIQDIESKLPELTKSIWKGNVQHYSVEIDLKKAITSIEESLLNTSLKEKIIKLNSICNLLKKDEAISCVKPYLQGGILQTAIAEVYDRDFNLQSTSKNGSESDGLIKEFHILKSAHYSIRAKFIEHIRLLIINEHNPTFFDVSYLYKESPWVPLDNQVQIGRAIYAGFLGDWMTCGLFLLPIVEIMLGSYLNSNGQSTIKCNSNGTQENLSLSELLSDESVIKILGEEVVFELNFLLIDKSGYKLRHSSAHGGFSDKEFYGDSIKIIWWLIIKLLDEKK